MYKQYKRNVLIILVLVIAMLGWNYHVKQIAASSNENDVNINMLLSNDDFQFIFNEPIYYPEEDLLYFQFNQSLINPLYISGDNTFKLYDSEGKELISEPIEEGINYYSLDNATELIDSNEYFRLAVYNGKALVMDALKMSVNIVRFEDLSDYTEEGKSRREMQREVKYFIYQYQNDPILEIEDLTKTDTATEFKGSIKDQHDKLIEILDNLEYNENSQDEIIEYFKSEIPSGDYLAYTNSQVVSEKQVMYNEIMSAVQYNLSVEIINLENELQNAGYVSAEDLANLEAGLNILEQRNVLQAKLDEYSNVEIGEHSD
ncbi:hypothetical protein R2F61_07095 [Mollicutes bacterium LVI A0078]|nr:hypothetical protein RZE84_07100 [Mollicutes bacterium LVI A0075]WOO90490.1 hypothetical protein R2F61_07095 [Mollicutes bacterium LVI A0078]